MDLFDDPTGLIAFSLIAAAVAAVPISRAILARYQRRIDVLMREGGNQPEANRGYELRSGSWSDINTMHARPRESPRRGEPGAVRTKDRARRILNQVSQGYG